MSIPPTSQLGDVADTNPETLPVSTDPTFAFRYIDLGAVSNGSINWNAVAEFKYSTAPSRARRLVRSGDVLFGTVRPGLSSHAYIESESMPLVASTGFSVVRAKQGKSHPRYLLHAVLSNQVRLQAEKFAVGSNYPAVNDGDVRQFCIFTPQVEEQAKVAEVLDTVDAALRQTDAIINKLRLIKQGLLHDLLTRGIDDNGELRVPQAAAPHLYKRSPLGWIPKGYNMLRLGDCGTITSGVTVGRAVTGAGTVERPYLRVANVQDGYLDLSEIKTIRIFRSELSQFRLEHGDVLMNEGGDFDKLGRGTIWEGQIDDCLHQNHVFRVRCDPARLQPGYLAAYSASTFGKKYFVQASKQTTNLASINSTQLKEFIVCAPPISEQRATVARIAESESALATEEHHLRKLRAIRAGLMDSLLSGRTRVTALLNA